MADHLVDIHVSHKMQVMGKIQSGIKVAINRKKEDQRPMLLVRNHKEIVNAQLQQNLCQKRLVIKRCHNLHYFHPQAPHLAAVKTVAPKVMRHKAMASQEEVAINPTTRIEAVGVVANS
jgi:hypothetical protein